MPEPTRYWSLDDAIERGRERPFEGGADDAVTALHDVLEEAVVPQVAADVPVGAFLSGGIDSTTIVALMQANSSRPVRHLYHWVRGVALRRGGSCQRGGTLAWHRAPRVVCVASGRAGRDPTITVAVR